MRLISNHGKYGGEPCPTNLMEISNCEKEGFADNSVPDCGSKVDCVMTEWKVIHMCPDCWGADKNITRTPRSQAATGNINNIS